MSIPTSKEAVTSIGLGTEVAAPWIGDIATLQDASPIRRTAAPPYRPIRGIAHRQGCRKPHERDQHALTPTRVSPTSVRVSVTKCSHGPPAPTYSSRLTPHRKA
eukprot:scaffold1060_cov246-Pinguiococcus_pyrenoidosus.AAC.7